MLLQITAQTRDLSTQLPNHPAGLNFAFLMNACVSYADGTPVSGLTAKNFRIVQLDLFPELALGECVEVSGEDGKGFYTLYVARKDQASPFALLGFPYGLVVTTSSLSHGPQGPVTTVSRGSTFFVLSYKPM